MRLLFCLLATALLVACGAGMPTVKYGSDAFVTVGHFNSGLTVNLTPQARELARKHCEKFGKTARYTGIYRDSGVGPEEFDFECVGASVAQEIVEKSKPKNAPQRSTGSGILISKDGLVVTNQHVVSGCDTINVNLNGSVAPANLLHEDGSNDLALVSVTDQSWINVAASKFSSQIPSVSSGLFRSSEVQLAEEVLVAGYPFGDTFSASLKVTSGIVSSKKGLNNNSSEFQLDAAVQGGNSGGPVYDRSGQLIGIVVSQLNKIKTAKMTGSIPENVNFAIKGQTVSLFLESSGVTTPQIATERPTLENKTIAQIAEVQTVFLECRNQ